MLEAFAFEGRAAYARSAGLRFFCGKNVLRPVRKCRSRRLRRTAATVGTVP